MMNSQMPKGRGMVKWMGFAAIPEQLVGVRNLIGDQEKVSKPILTQDAIGLIEHKLSDSLFNNKEILLTYYKDGYILNENITVTHIDLHTKVVKCTDAFRSVCKFNLNDIIEAK